MLAPPTPIIAPLGPDKATLLRIVWPYLQTYRARILTTLCCLMLAKVAQVGIPVVMKTVVDHLTPEIVIAGMPAVLVLLYGSLRFSTTLFAELRDRLFVTIAQHVKRDIAVSAFGRLHDLSLRFHLEHRVGSVLRDVRNGADGITTLLSTVIFSVLPILFEFSLVAALLLWKFDWRFVAISYGAVVVYVGFTVVAARRHREIRRRANELNAAASAHALDSLLNFETVKACGERDFEMQRYDACLEKCEAIAVREEHSLNILAIGHSLIVAIAVTTVLFLVVKGVAARSLTLGDVILINGLLIQMYVPMGILGNIYSSISRSIADMERMFELLDVQQEVPDSPTASSLPAVRVTVEFRAVRFGYDPTRKILLGISFQILEGQTVAVVGHSGAGKSTLARLLLRFYDPTGGAVLVNGVDVRDLRQAALRGAIGCVSQDAVLFNDTIRFNISYGCPGVTLEEIVEATRAANIHDFIVSLPQAYDTMVGERGLKLSAGEKQRLAIARALVRNPSILIFDEASSALDSESEKAIHSQIRRGCSGRATLIIAHRLSTVVDADEILVLDQGRIVERGQHRSLLRLGGRYARMWELQQTSGSADIPLSFHSQKASRHTTYD